VSEADPAARAKALMERLDREAREGGNLLNPDAEMTRMLCEGLAVNLERYGYPSCPCRLAAGKRDDDLDLICPCDYRDPDLAEFGACYCGLYVSEDVAAGRKPLRSIPERRPPPGEGRAGKAAAAPRGGRTPVWRCRVCGYLCAAEHPPGRCPVCKAAADRFEAFGFPVPVPVWRCKVCGYLCAAEHPPGKCPVCKAAADRFEGFA
jgi:ferredoxin-thioredoxin reductase catalytic chain